MIIIDTPGHNDPDQENRDDTKLSSSIVRYLRDNELLQQQENMPQNRALSGILQCMMIPKSGRISHSSIKSMSRLLMSLTLSYQQREIYSETPII